MPSSNSCELSVVVPSHNRRELLRRCLDSLARQTQDPACFEVIVLDDGSSDGTAKMVEALETPLDLRLLRLRQKGWAGARNVGVEASRGDVCLHIDDDIIASPGLVAAHIATHCADRSAIGIGRLVQQPPSARDWYAHALAKGLADHYEDLAGRPADWVDCYGANFSAPRTALLEVGGFATDLPATVDLELAYRLCRAGCVPTYVPEGEGVHDDEKRVAQMLKDAKVQGQSHVEVVDRHPETERQLLNWESATSGRELVLRRLLVALRVPPSPLAALGALTPGNGRKMIWLHFVRRYAFWRSVRSRVSRKRWRELTRRPRDLGAKLDPIHSVP